jgi:cytoskeletal protein RodZ
MLRLTNPIRRWRRMGLCGLFCLVLPGFAIAQTDASTLPKKPAAPASASSTAKAKKSSTGPTTTKHTSSRTSSRSSAHKASKSVRGKKTSKKRGQQAIDSTRARQIQEALIREHYMQGEPSGTWDATSQAAMQKFQADQGWQSKQIPDARALIKLGLGPSHDHLLNPESAMTSTPAAGDPKTAAKPAPSTDGVPQQ